LRILKFIVLKGIYSIYKFKNEAVLPDWIYSSDFWSVTKTDDELSVVAVQTELISEDVECSSNWRILKIAGPLDFSLIGIIADVAAILKEKKIPIFTISAYETDYILIKEKDLSSGIKSLTDKGHQVITNLKS
jgi:uncharacterized protein